MKIRPDSLIQRNQEIVSSEIDGETVMMDTGFEKYFGMKAIATRIWQLAEHEISFQSLCETLTREYEVSLEQCHKDVLPFIQELDEQNMIHLKHPPN